MDRYLALAGQPSGVARNLETQLAGVRQNTAQLQTQVQELTTGVLAGTPLRLPSMKPGHS